MHMQAFWLVAISALALLPAGCDRPEIVTVERPPSPPIEPFDAEFPPVLGPARIFERWTPHENSRIDSRFVLFEDSTFELQEMSPPARLVAWSGTYSRTDSSSTDIRFDFGTWGQASGRFESSRLHVEFSIEMLIQGGENGVYVLVPNG